MGYRLELGETPLEGLQRIALEQIDSTSEDIAANAGRPEIAVHRFRRRCKKIRALLRLFRGELEPAGIFRQENAALRDASRTLAHVRDSDVMIKTYDRLVERYGDEIYRRGFGPFRRALTIERRRLEEGFRSRTPALIEQAWLELLRVRERVHEWHFEAEGFAAIRGGLHKTYRRAWRRRREAMHSPTAERLHEWRKRVKYHRNHLRLISNLWPALIQPRSEEAEVLGELLGDDHDLAILREKVVRDHDSFRNIGTRQAFVALIDRARNEIYSEIVVLGARLFAEPPDQFVSSIGTWWQIWEEGTTLLLPSPTRREPKPAQALAPGGEQARPSHA